MSYYSLFKKCKVDNGEFETLYRNWGGVAPSKNEEGAYLQRLKNAYPDFIIELLHGPNSSENTFYSKIDTGVDAVKPLR